MQGKFKLTVLHNVGHSVQEDDFKGTARMLYEFMKDFRIPMTLSEVSEKQLVGIAHFHPNLNKYWDHQIKHIIFMFYLINFQI